MRKSYGYHKNLLWFVVSSGFRYKFKLLPPKCNICSNKSDRMKSLFGTDGIRGVAGEFPLDEKTIRTIGGSLAGHFGKRLGRAPRFVIGRDTRESGLWIERAFCQGAAEKGAECDSARIITTPGVAFLTGSLGFDAGVVISASHNPFEDNGLKIFLPSGEKLDGQTESLIERDISSGRQNGFGPTGGRPADFSNAERYQKKYLDHLRNQFNRLSVENFKMVIDCANGAASQLAPQLFEEIGAEAIVINNQPDGKNINLQCGSLYIENLQKKVLEEKADFGVAFDGDADRSLFVDERGNFVDGDAALWVMGGYLKDTGSLKNNTIVATVMSNIGLEIALKTRNIELLRTPVGDKYVLAELLRTNSSIGGEQSGHIIFPEKSLVGDGLFTTLYLLEAQFRHRQKLSELTAGFQKFPQVLINVKVREKIPFEKVPEINKAADELERELGVSGRLLLRYSGTENLARVMIEGSDQEIIDRQARRLAGVIEDHLG